MRAQAVERLVKNIARYNDHITTGFLGTPHICNVLSDYGRSDVAAGWKAEGNTLKSLDVEIPFNTTATVKVPAPSKDAVTCSAGVAAVDYKDGCAIFNVGSGQYTFTVK